MDKRNFSFSKLNYLLLEIGVAAIVLGFLLMAGPGSTEAHFEPDIFSFRRVTLAPAVCFLGFIFVIFAIVYKPKNKND